MVMKKNPFAKTTPGKAGTKTGAVPGSTGNRGGKTPPVVGMTSTVPSTGIPKFSKGGKAKGRC